MDSSGSSQLVLVEGQDALTDKILAALPQLSKKHNEIARFILDHQDVLVSATDIHNMERTAMLTADDRLQAAAAEIRRARQTLIVGCGLAAASLLNALIAAMSLGAPQQTAQSLHQVDPA